MTEYLPEGCLIGTADNRSSLLSYYTLSECMTSGKILEAPCIICDSHHNLILDLGCMKGFNPPGGGRPWHHRGNHKGHRADIPR